MHFFTKYSGEMVNNVDTEGAVWSGPALFAYAFLSEKLQFKNLGQ